MTTRTAERLQALEYILSDGLSYSWFRVTAYNEDECTATVLGNTGDYDADDNEVWQRHEIGPDDIARGLRMVREYAQGKRELYNGEWKFYLDRDPNWKPKQANEGSYLWELVKFDQTNGEDGDYDANTADMVLQYAVFGQVIYG